MILKVVGEQRIRELTQVVGSSEATATWKRSEISHEKLPEVDSIFFGAFQVVDKKLESDRSGESYIDFAYGSSQTSFAGVHRFSIERLGGEDGSDDGEGGGVRLSMSCVTCNPQEDKSIAPEWSSILHRTYAMLLFREGVAEVVE